jgi:hypothetical protein
LLYLSFNRFGFVFSETLFCFFNELQRFAFLENFRNAFDTKPDLLFQFNLVDALVDRLVKGQILFQNQVLLHKLNFNQRKQVGTQPNKEVLQMKDVSSKALQGNIHLQDTNHYNLKDRVAEEVLPMPFVPSGDLRVPKNAV